MTSGVQALLAAAKQPWQKGFEQRLNTLPAEFITIIRDKSNGLSTSDQAFADYLHASDATSRQAIAALLFPHFPVVAARTLEALLTRHPYPQGYARRSFRAPGHRLQAESAAQWLWQVWQLTREYPQSVEWFAVHAGLLPAWTAYRLGTLFAQAIDDSNEEVVQILQGTASSQHPVARMGRHVPSALMASSRPDAWTLAEGLLLAAQRQEGLRQVILESVDEAHPDAFVRALRLILQEDLLRFAACLRAADVWFGLNYDVTDLKTVRALLTQALGYLETPDSARQAVQDGSGVETYVALFTLAMRDAVSAAELARPLLVHPDAEKRMAAVQFLQASGLITPQELSGLLADPDVRIGAIFAAGFNRWQTEDNENFGALEAYAARLPEAGEQAHRPLLFPWLGQVPTRTDMLDLLPALLAHRPFTALEPHLNGMSMYGKTAALRLMAERGKESPFDGSTRGLLMRLLQDRLPTVSQEAVEVAEKLTLALDDSETDLMLGLLKRKSADLRRGLIRLLANDAARAQASADTLLATRNTEQRQAGLQLLLEVKGTLPADFVPKGGSEETLAARLLTPDTALTLANGLGLFDPAKLAPLPVLQARAHDYPQEVRRGAKLLTSLDALIHAHREDPLTDEGWDGEDTVLLGTLRPYLMSRDNTPFSELWLEWWQGRPQPQPGDLTRMHWAMNHFVASRSGETAAVLEVWESGDETDRTAPKIVKENAVQALREATVHRMFGPPVPLWLEYAGLLPRVVHFLTEQQASETDTTLALDAWETVLNLLPPDAEVLEDPKYSWRNTDPRELVAFLRPHIGWDTWPLAQQERHWGLALYSGRGFSKLPLQRPGTQLLLHAETQGWASQDDLLDHLIGPRASNELRDYTRRKLRENMPVTPAWLDAVNTVRARVLEVESVRGDLETPATPAAGSLQRVEGAQMPLTLLAALGKNPLRRGYMGNNEGRDVTFSHLIRVSFPGAEDTPASFASQVAALKLSETRLLDLAMFAPQWAALVAGTLGWKGLHGAVLWLHAHTRDSSWSVPQEVREAWEAEIGERTPLTGTELLEGAVDVGWFWQVYRDLKQERFQTLLGAAKYASSSTGHKRAELFARAILGQEPEDGLLARITDKRQQDAVRALGLLPLPKKGANRAAQKLVESRYRTLADFRRGARQFGAQRQASERLAADIGMQNLARTAGYSDPQRLMWAMEARMAPDWTQTVEAEGVTLGIDLTPQGDASLRVMRGEKALKSVPASLGKHLEVLTLKATLSELTATRKRMRSALEEAMVCGDLFQGTELIALAAHPVIAPMLRSLVWMLNEEHLGWWQEESIQTQSGSQPVSDRALRLAHPHDLYASGAWSEFQRQVVEQEIQQPFKQVFREYYPLTQAEQGAKRSLRYDGHHVQPTQAAALLKTRGWITVPEEGVRKTFHAEGINVWVDSSLGYGTPNEVEGAPIGAVYFIQRDQTELMPLASVPPRLLSETLRDLDLVVSVAHVGGVDPEASQSTVEMREQLIAETLRLLKLDNVRLENRHAHIEGHHARYSVHLGSGTVHRLPGGFLCVIPVHNQHQGRLFLPFADPDPKTAEVVSKVLLLAEDQKILDPTILEQLR
ncbi:DUF5724 domain-containing protein (plasmid) [Deinococcus radiomollis]|uniref:DUF4132 domain-containing protein n=1 Tax=Deinococcus radiomollis TaxID=468916 RepID=UPI00389203BC